MMRYPFILFLSALSFQVFSQHTMKLIDKHATKETKNLYNNLSKLSKDHILFGHQHATESGHGWAGNNNRSDVRSVTGSHPAVIGVDFGGLSGRLDSVIEKEKKRLIKVISDTYNRGGITTISWHFSNPSSSCY